MKKPVCTCGQSRINALVKLSNRQRAVLDGIAQGKKRSAIAADLGLSLSAVNRHAEKIFQRLACHTGAAAVAKFLRLPIPASTRPKRPSARKSTR